MNVTRIDHVQVAAPAGCEAEERAFYGGLLGLDELASRLGAAGIEVSYDDTIPDAKRFYAADPFGNRLEFRQA